MTTFSRPVRRETIEPYKHYQRTIIVGLYADTISLRLKGTRTAYEIPVAHLARRLMPARSTTIRTRETSASETIVANS